MRARVIRSHEPREQGKLPNKANFKQPSGNQWVTAGFQYHGTTRLGKTRQIAPLGYEGPLLRASGPAEQREGNDDYRSSGATEQQSDHRGMHFTPGYPISCGRLIRLPRTCWTISE